MYKCQQCENKAEVQGKQDIDINYNAPLISEWIVCESCGYTVLKDTADKQILLDVCEYMIKELKGVKGKAFNILPIIQAIKKAKQIV